MSQWFNATMSCRSRVCLIASPSQNLFTMSRLKPGRVVWLGAGNCISGELLDKPSRASYECLLRICAKEWKSLSISTLPKKQKKQNDLVVIKRNNIDDGLWNTTQLKSIGVGTTSQARLVIIWFDNWKIPSIACHRCVVRGLFWGCVCKAMKQ